MDGSEVDGCFETIDPAYRSGNDELNSEFIMLTVGSVSSLELEAHASIAVLRIFCQ